MLGFFPKNFSKMSYQIYALKMDIFSVVSVSVTT